MIEHRILLVAGPHHGRELTIEHGLVDHPPPTLRPIACHLDGDLDGIIYPMAWSPKADGVYEFAFAFENNCYRRTQHETKDGLILYEWIDGDGRPDGTPAPLRAAGLIVQHDAQGTLIINERGLARADFS
jgi:hypothetical protein